MDLSEIPAAKRDGFLFGEFIGACLLEVPPDLEFSKHFAQIPYYILGEVTIDPRLTVSAHGAAIWEDDISRLAERWSETFCEVMK